MVLDNLTAKYKILNTFLHTKSKTKNSNTTNMLHKRQSHIIKQIFNTLIQHNIIIMKTNKGRTIVVIHKDTYKNK